MSPLTLSGNPTERQRLHELRAATARLNRRIALVACVVMAELWALTAALDSWAEGNTAHMGWILGFQAVSFLLALSLASGEQTGPRTAAVRPARVRLAPPRPVAGE